MPLVALIKNTILNIRRYTLQLAAVHLTVATVEEAQLAVFIMCTPEVIPSKNGQGLRKLKKLLTICEHIVAKW